MHEQHSGFPRRGTSDGFPGLPQVQHGFLELPKYTAGAHPTELVDKWALFFRDAEDFDVIPPELDEDPLREAFEIARLAELREAMAEIQRLKGTSPND